MSIYADSSFFVSLYLHDRHFTEAQRMVPQHSRIWLTPLHRAEWAHAVAQHLASRKMSTDDAQVLTKDFERDRASRFWLQGPLPELAFERCVQLAGQYGARLGLATLDTLHVASALELGAERFWTFDVRQTKLARAVGLKTGA
ncbi:MAG: type II toxin-antitoxin system VapC family toxin [Candidatus Korobacteraceae bacterium]